jgi:hypothetical protein
MRCTPLTNNRDARARRRNSFDKTVSSLDHFSAPRVKSFVRISTMAEEFKGSLWKKAPPRDVDRKGAENWLRVRSTEEGAEGLWRIHNKLYDLSSYIKIHPGGSEWLELTKVG